MELYVRCYKEKVFELVKTSVVKEALLFLLWEFTLEMIKGSGIVTFLPF